MSLLNQEGFIWMNGEFIAWQDAKVHCLTYTFHYGFGVLEGVRAYQTDRGPAIFRLRDHTDRLFRSAKILKIPIGYDKEQLNKIQQDIILKNKLTSAYIRPMIFYGAEYLGLNPVNLSSNIMVAAWKWDSYIGNDSLTKGSKVCTSSFTRNYPNSVFSKSKANGNYMNSILALQEAKSLGFDEVLLLDHQGFVSEGSGQNIFIVRNNILYTPELTSALEGITRETIFTLAADLNLIIKEKNITRDEVYIADEAFFTGTAVEVTPICEIDGRVIGNGSPGEITKKIQEIYLNLVRGRELRYQHWLTYL